MRLLPEKQNVESPADLQRMCKSGARIYLIVLGVHFLPLLIRIGYIITSLAWRNPFAAQLPLVAAVLFLLLLFWPLSALSGIGVAKVKLGYITSTIIATYGCILVDLSGFVIHLFKGRVQYPLFCIIAGWLAVYAVIQLRHLREEVFRLVVADSAWVNRKDKGGNLVLGLVVIYSFINYFIHLGITSEQ